MRNKSYLAFYEEKKEESISGIMNFDFKTTMHTITGNLDDELRLINIQQHALETGIVTLEESKKFKNLYQLEALESTKANAEESLMFYNQYQINALKYYSVTAKEAIKINDEIKALALNSRKTTAEEATMFSNEVQISALRNITNITVVDALKLNYCFQIDLLKSAKFTVDQVSRLKNTFSDQLATTMNISIEESINYVENIAPVLNENYYIHYKEDKRCNVKSSYSHGLILEKPYIIKLTNHNCNLDLFVKNFCTPNVRYNIKLIHIAEITENNQLIPLNISDILGLYDGFDITNINLLTEICYSLFPVDQVL